MKPIVFNDKSFVFQFLSAFRDKWYFYEDTYDTCEIFKMFFAQLFRLGAIILASTIIGTMMLSYPIMGLVLMFWDGISLNALFELDIVFHVGYLLWAVFFPFVVLTLWIEFVNPVIYDWFYERRGRKNFNASEMAPTEPSSISKMYEAFKNKYCVPVKFTRHK